MAEADSEPRSHRRKVERSQRKARRRMERRIERDRRRLHRSQRKLVREFGDGAAGAGATSAEGPAADPTIDPAYRAAQRRATLKATVAVHFIAYAMVLALLLRVAGFRVMGIVALSWGIGLVLHYALAFVVPDLRRRWIHEEVGRQVHEGVTHQRRHAETRRTRSLEDLSASIAHEIRNPISAAKSLVQQMGEDPVSDENVRFADVALAELDRVERSISHLLRFAREEEIRVESTTLEAVTAAAIETLREPLVAGGVELRIETDTPGPLRGDPEKLRRVVINLIANACDALREARTPHPKLDLVIGESLAGSEVWLRVRDNGPGIEPARLDHIFDPFHTSKDYGNGLGLALSRKVVEAHGGDLEVWTALGEGTEFILTFPKERSARPAETRR